MIRIFVFATFLIFISTFSKAQSTDTLQAAKLYGNAVTLLEKGDYSAAFERFDEAKAIYAAAGKEEMLLKILNKEAVAAYQLQDFKAMKVYLMEIEPLAEKYPDNATSISYYNYQGVYYSAMNNYEEALRCYLRYEVLTLAYLKAKDLPKTPMIAVYNNIATVYGEKLDRKNALHYFNKALLLCEEEQNFIKVAMIHTNLAILNWDDINAKLAKLREANAVLDVVNEEAAQLEKQNLLSKINNEIAHCFIKLDKRDSAQVYLMKNIQNDYQEYIEDTYISLAEISIEEKNYYNAESYLQKALAVLLELHGIYHKKIAVCYEFLARIEEFKNNKTAAINYIRKGIGAICFDFDPAAKDELPKIDRVLDLWQLSNLLIIYQRLESPQKAAKIAQLAFQLAAAAEKETGTSENQIEVLKFYYEAYEQAVYSALLAHEENPKTTYLEDALQYMEKSRSQLLLNALYPNTQSAEQDSLLQKGRELEHIHKKLVYEVFEHRSFEETDALEEKTTRLEKIESQQISWLQTLKTERPKLYEMRYGNNNTTSLAAIQKGLNVGDCLLEYLVGENKVLALSITPQTSILKSLGNAQDLNADIKILYELLTTIPKGKGETEAISAYATAALSFYEKWVKPLIPSDVQRLIVVPDGALAYIPFEALLTEKGTTEGFKNLPYLIKKYRVHYRYAAALDMKAQSKKTKNEGNVLAFAPSYDTKNKKSDESELPLRMDLADLPGARAEVEMLFKKFRGSFYFGNDAGEKRFRRLEKSDHYSVIHFAMHGIVDLKHPSNSGLVFTDLNDGEDNVLQAKEIIQFDLSANLVVLSACETGYGKYQHGEGVVSLGRGFMYAGVPAVVSTLWQLNDHTGNRIMTLFYELLSRGYAIDEALHEAKLVFLSEVTHIAAHPFFWASFVSIGDESPIDIGRKTFIERYWLYGMLIVFIILGIVIFVWRINQLSLGRPTGK